MNRKNRKVDNFSLSSAFCEFRHGRDIETQKHVNGMTVYLRFWVHTKVLDVCMSVSCCYMRREEKPTNATECFIALMIRSTRIGYFYAIHHQELETICVLLPPVVCSAWLLVVGVQVQDNRL